MKKILFLILFALFGFLSGQTAQADVMPDDLIAPAEENKEDAEKAAAEVKKEVTGTAAEPLLPGAEPKTDAPVPVVEVPAQKSE